MAERFDPDEDAFLTDSKDEIGILGRNLHELYGKLRENYEELEHKNRLLEEENERQEVFLRASSHQLKTPIAAALLLVEGMMNEVGKYKDTKTYLPEVKKQLLSMRKIVEDILYLNYRAENIQQEKVAVEALAQELGSTGVKIGSVYQALGSDGNQLGVVVESVSTEGYGGNTVLYLGVTNEGMLNDFSILEISETAGLGMKAPDVLAPQFHDKKVDSFVYTKSGAAADNEIDAIAGATITTSAVTNAVNGGLKAAQALTEAQARRAAPVTTTTWWMCKPAVKTTAYKRYA